MEQSTSAPSGMISTPAGGFISDSDDGDDVGLINDNEQYDFNANDSDSEEPLKENYKTLSNETKEETAKEQKKAYKSSKFGEVPEDVVERLLAYKDRVQDLDKLDEVDKFRSEIQTAANKKFMAAKKEREEVAQEREAAQSLLEYAKSSPLEFLKATGVDINQHIRTRLEEDMKLAQMSPEQRQEYYRVKEFERSNQEMQQKVAAYEKQIQQQKEQQMQFERQGRLNDLGKMIAQLHKESNLPESPDVVQTILAEMQAASEFQKDMGIPVSSAKLMQNIKSRLYSDALKLIGSVESYEQIQPYDGDGKFRDAIMKLAAGHATKNRTLAPGQHKARNTGRPKSAEPNSREEDEPLFLGDSDLRRMKMRGEW